MPPTRATTTPPAPKLPGATTANRAQTVPPRASKRVKRSEAVASIKKKQEWAKQQQREQRDKYTELQEEIKKDEATLASSSGEDVPDLQKRIEEKKSQLS